MAKKMRVKLMVKRPTAVKSIRKIKMPMNEYYRKFPRKWKA